jgi:acyl carrier protein
MTPPTPTEAALIDVLSKGLKLQRTAPIEPTTAITRPAPGAPPCDTLGLDSVDILEIAVLLDKHFGVMLEEGNQEVRDALASISALAAFIDRHRPT